MAKDQQLASDEFAVVGYTAPKGSRTGFGSLLLARPDPKHGWLYVGRVGSGFSDELIGEVSKRIEGGGGRKPTAHVPTQDTDLRAATWFAPRFVVEVFYRGIGGQKLLRQASLKAVRADKDIADLEDSDRAGPAMASGGQPASRRPARDTKKSPATGRTPPALSSPGKILFLAMATPSRRYGTTTQQ